MTKAKLLMIQGTSSGSGKSTIVTAFCRIFSDNGYRVVPFKAQNMSSNVYVIGNTLEKMALAQAIQSVASRKKPDARMNPILLMPLGDYRSNIILHGRFYTEIHAKEYYERFILQKGFPLILRALESLRRENDVVIIEGAGSPAEINILKYDAANMLLAEKVCAPVIIASDIERGGCFASMVGTIKLLKPIHRNFVKGFLINKFRGDKSLLDPAIKSVEKITKKEILGIIPKINFDLPNEDSLDGTDSNKSKLPNKSWNSEINLLARKIRESVDVQKILSKVVGLER